jgi:hypothetical protein
MTLIVRDGSQLLRKIHDPRSTFDEYVPFHPEIYGPKLALEFLCSVIPEGSRHRPVRIGGTTWVYPSGRDQLHHHALSTKVRLRDSLIRERNRSASRNPFRHVPDFLALHDPWMFNGLLIAEPEKLPSTLRFTLVGHVAEVLTFLELSRDRLLPFVRSHLGI